MLLLLIFDVISFVYGILGGMEIEIEQAPYQVNYGDVCGGALIQPIWVITSAHCGKTDFIRAGNKNRLEGREIKIEEHIVHPKFGKKHEFGYDIQLLRLRKPLLVTSKIKAIEFYNSMNGVNYIDVAGWGYPAEKTDYLTTLQLTTLRLVPKKRCQAVDLKWYNHTLRKNMFCAGGVKADACQGDSGSAAVFKGYLVGISSFGYGCGRKVPGVYISVLGKKMQKWINRYTHKNYTYTHTNADNS